MFGLESTPRHWPEPLVGTIVSTHEARRMTPEERAALFERTANYRHGYDDGRSAGISAGRLQGLLAAAFVAAILLGAYFLF
jgi:hypothetical protein